ncbi:MAG: hypothetical protein MK116_10120 [Phycisphaerales bacterium]|nr:hypothetical protein [Phycisphaerales bacterium]
MRSRIVMMLAGCAMIATTAVASPYINLETELYHIGEQGHTLRLYANLDAGARIDAVYGNAQGELSIETDGSFYQDAAGGNTSQAINSAFFSFVPALQWDSYVSIGALYQNGDPFGSNNLNDIGIDWTNFEAGLGLQTDNGSWFVTPEDPQGEELGGRVFLGQFTLQEGSTELSVQVNLQGKDADGNTWTQIGAWGWATIPAPGAISLLAIVGLVGSSRRR